MKEEKISTGKTILVIISALLILVMAQVFAILMGDIPVMLGVPAVMGNVIAGVLYPMITYAGIRILCKKVWKKPMEECKLTKFSVKPLWCIAAIAMPCMVSAVLLCMPGHWENNNKNMPEILEIITGGIFFYGIGAGFVEEMIFRGVIMRALEKRYNRMVAILVPSVLFGALHIIGSDLGVIDTIQLLIAGSIVGILFSVVTYESGNVWNSAILHSIWNMIIIGGVLHIGDVADEWAIYNYVLETDSFLITGGDFGIEASIVSVAAYAIFAAVAVIRTVRFHTEKSDE